MRLAGAGSADEDGVALGGEKAALVQVADEWLVDGRGGEVELGERLGQREPGHAHLVGDGAGAHGSNLGEEQFADDARHRVLRAGCRLDDLVVGRAHAGELQRCHQIEDLVAFHQSSPGVWRSWS